ncbi:hypothetical protein CPB84DRAFT_1760600, partial [Gymnopilus junonius]
MAHKCGALSENQKLSENVPTFLKVAIEAYWFQGKPLKDIIPLTIRIDAAIPKVVTSFVAKEPHLPQIIGWAKDAENGRKMAALT